MIADKLILPDIQKELAQVIETFAQDKAQGILFHTRQDTQGFIDQIYDQVCAPLEQLFDVFPQVQISDIILLCRYGKAPLTPTKIEEEYAYFLAHQGIGFYLLHPSANRIQCLAKAALPESSTQNLALETIADSLREGGALSQLSHQYEPRQAQIALLEFIAQHFNQNSIGVAEGGTGVGKSFAYLIPAMQWAQQNEERIVISTATIALQQQLMSKDIPFVKRLMKSRVKAVLVKGKQNYLCLHHLTELLEEEKMFLKENDPLLQIAAWAETTKTGDKSDLPFLPGEEIWSRISADTETCLGTKCAYYQKCFVFKARKEAMQAQILVVNHHLFFADLVLRNQLHNASLSILPTFRKVIFDEAHQLENSATHFFSGTFSHYSIQRQIARLYRRRGAIELGLLAQLATQIPSSEYSQLCLQKTRDALEELRQAQDTLQAKNMLFQKTTFRLHQHNLPEIEAAVLLPLEDVAHHLKNLTTQLDDLNKIAEDLCTDHQLVAELCLVEKRLAALTELTHNFLHYREFEDMVFWAEQRKNRLQEIYYVYICTPLNIAAVLDKYLYQQGYTIIMVSATLTFEKKFDFFLKKTGLYSLEQPFSCQLFLSPFNYTDRTLFFIPADIPPLEQDQSFNQYSYQLIIDLLLKNPKTGILILFTSYKALRDCADALQPFLQKKNIPLLKQGDDDRQKLVQNFVRHKGAVLLGTDSFWEGIDIDNAALKILIIFKLPFQPPNIPLIQAKQEKMEKEGLNSFTGLQVPEAAIKLKQGFGRLMRKSTDFGVIILLDNRVIKKKYGELFLKTLPKNDYQYAPYQEILEQTHNFLTKRKQKD